MQSASPTHLVRAVLPNHPRGIATSAAPLIAHMRQDKKMTAGSLPFVLAHRIGDAFVARDVPLGDVEAFLDRVLAEA